MVGWLVDLLVVLLLGGWLTGWLIARRAALPAGLAFQEEASSLSSITPRKSGQAGAQDILSDIRDFAQTPRES